MKKLLIGQNKATDGGKYTIKFFIRVLFVLLVLAGIIFVCTVLIPGIQAERANDNLDSSYLSDIVFKKIYFNKYIIVGNRTMDFDKGKLMSEQAVFYVQGTADVQYNLRNFKFIGNKSFHLPEEIDPEKLITTMYHGNIKYTGTKVKGIKEVFPYMVEIKINNSDVDLIYEIKPYAVFEIPGKSDPAEVETNTGSMGVSLVGIEDVARSAKKSLNKMIHNSETVLESTEKLVLSSVETNIESLGVYMGGIADAAELADNSLNKMVHNPDAVPGSASSGGESEGYVATENFFVKLKLTEDLNEADKEKILASAKKLVAAEILSDKALHEELKKEFEKNIKDFYMRYYLKVDKFDYSTNL